MRAGTDASSIHGWERRFVVDAARVAEIVALYQSLGYETSAEALGSDQAEASCAGCPLVTLRRLYAIFTRRGFETTTHPARAVPGTRSEA